MFSKNGSCKVINKKLKRNNWKTGAKLALKSAIRS